MIATPAICKKNRLLWLTQKKPIKKNKKRGKGKIVFAVWGDILYFFHSFEEKKEFILFFKIVLVQNS